MSDAEFAALRAAVTLARNENIRRVAVLRIRLHQLGFGAATTDAALKIWANYEARKP